MKIEAKGNGLILKEVYEGITLETREGKELQICARDHGFDVKFGNGKWFHVDEHTEVLPRIPKYNTSKTPPFFG